MRLSEYLGPICDELAGQEGFVDAMRQSYQEVLSADGVTFPTDEVKEAQRLYTAQAQVDRGAVALEPDGSPVDLTHFDCEAAGQLIQAHQNELLQEERLDSLVHLGLLSKAGSLLIARMEQTDYGTDEISSSQILRSYMLDYKRFVQIGIATEEWGPPWGELVANGFEGPDMGPPLSRDAVYHAIGDMQRTWLRDLRRDHFKHLTTYQFNIHQGLCRSEAYLAADENQLALGGAIGLFYRHSQQGCDDLLDALTAEQTLNPAVDWPRLMAAASYKASRYLPKST